jgi:NhaP-type Na+/H+ or K+/H+ antiporter
MAEGLELSGIVAILTNGIFLNYYGTPNISRASRKVIKITVDTVAYITESLVFIFLGMGVFAIRHPYKEMGPGTIILAIVNLNLARFFNVGIVSCLVNKTRTKASRITNKQMFVMWIAGLRGAMAYALALDSSKSGMSGKVILIVTLLYSLFTILGISTILYPVMNKCEVTAAHAKKTEEEIVVRSSEMKKNCPRRFKEAMGNFDKFWFSPLFIKDEIKIDKRDAKLKDPQKE